MKYSKLIVAAMILLNVGFAAVVLYAFIKVGEEPKVLITAWFGFTTGELWLLSGIKKAKIKNDSDKPTI